MKNIRFRFFKELLMIILMLNVTVSLFGAHSCRPWLQTDSKKRHRQAVGSWGLVVYLEL